jgi:tripartite-type tricarboxylate transporter receptor subunit TctC
MSARTLLAAALIGLAAGAGLLAMLAGGAAAQDAYPSRAIRIVAPFAPGGPPDVTARILGARMGELLGQAFVVDNRSGAGGNVGGDAVAKSAPDGYTLLMATVSTHVTNPGLYKHMPYDPIADFAPIGLIGVYPNVLVVPASAPVKDVRELIALLKANPGKYNYGSSGIGSMLHLCGDLLAKVAGVPMTHVPYRGAGPMTTGMLMGEVLTGFNGSSAILGQVKDGSLRALMVGTPERNATFPGVPSAREAGYPQLECYSWAALFAPAGTSPAIVAKLNQAKNQALSEPAIADRIREIGVDVTPGSTPEQLAGFLKEQLAAWTPIIKAAGVEMD